MPEHLEYGAATHVGLVRNNNEDCFLAEPSLGLWLIADGMGGHDAGEVASGIVKDSIHQSIKDGVELSEAISQSHSDVKKAAELDIGSKNMGTTVIALVSDSNRYQIAWVGDSRAYLWDPLNHSFEQISKDHSYVQALFDAGSISKEEMETHPQKNVITQSLGVSELDSVTVDSNGGTWSTGQKILLCSDGLSDLVSDKEIKDVVRKHQTKDNQELVNALVQTALDKGGIDNVTVEVISAPTEIGKSISGSTAKTALKFITLGVFAAAIAGILYFSF